MNESEEIRKAIDIYLMGRYKYRRSLVRLTPDHIVTTRRNSRIDLYLRIRRAESLFPPDSLVIARLGFSKERYRTWNALHPFSDRYGGEIRVRAYRNGIHER